MLGRTPGNISAIRPLKDGVIADFDVTEQMLRHFIQKVHQNRWAHPRVVVCVPSGVTGVEKRAVEEATLSAGRAAPHRGADGGGHRRRPAGGRAHGEHGRGHRRGPPRWPSSRSAASSSRSRSGSAATRLDDAIIGYVKREYKLMIGSGPPRR